MRPLTRNIYFREKYVIIVSLHLFSWLGYELHHVRKDSMYTHLKPASPTLLTTGRLVASLTKAGSSRLSTLVAKTIMIVTSR